MKQPLLHRLALIGALSMLAAPSGAQAPAAPAPGGAPAAAPAAPAAPAPARPPRTPTSFASPHGARGQPPRVMPAPDLPFGDIEVRVSSRNMELIEGRKVELHVSRQSIERGNTETTLEATTDFRGVVSFPGQGTESDFVYKVTVVSGDARFSSSQFQFRNAENGGIRVAVPIMEATTELAGLLVMSRGVIVIVPQDDLFSADVIWRIENFGDVAWLPKNVSFELPEGFRALNIREVPGDLRIERDGDERVKLVGTVAPGQHDLMFRMHLPTQGKSTQTFSFPSGVNMGQLRVFLDSSPTMDLKVEGFTTPEETRNPEGQRRLVVSREFITEKVRAPERIQVEITGIPTPPGGKNIAVGVAAVLALSGIGVSVRRRRTARPAVAELSKEDLERASNLLLEELIALEQAFQQGNIGRKTHDQARRQLLEAFARLRAEAAPA